MTVTLPFWFFHLAVFVAALGIYLRKLTTSSVQGSGMFEAVGEGLAALLHTLWFLLYLAVHLAVMLIIQLSL